MKNSPKQKPEAGFPQSGLHLLLMGKALEAYSAWLNHHARLLDFGLEQAQVGARLVAEVAEIRKQHFSKASTRVTELLVVHTKLSTLRFERQLKLFKSGAPPLGRSEDYERLVERQMETIAVLRSACGLPPLS